MSKEHVWSDWMGKFFPDQKEHFHLLMEVSHEIRSNTVTLTPSLERRPGPIHKRKIRNVCKTCNNGWMSRIVDRAKPWVEPAIQDRPVELDPAAQMAVATWATLTAVMAEYTDPKHMGVPPGDRTHLMKRSEPPPSWTVSLGRSVAPAWRVLRYRHHGGPMVFKNGEEHVATHLIQLSTIAMKSLAIQTASFTDQLQLDFYRSALRGWGLATVWPPERQSVKLPWERSLGDAEMLSLADGFTNLLTRQYHEELNRPNL